MTFEVALDSPLAIFAPGDTLSGTARWELASPPEGLELHLAWRTEGRGDPDMVVVETRTLKPTTTGEASFSFTLPASPWSFQGPLIHLLWTVELVAEPAAEAARVDFTLSPVGCEIQLQAAPDPVREKVEKAAGRLGGLLGRRRA